MSKMHEDLVLALAEIENPRLDGRANYGNYATIQSCLKTSKGVLAKHNLGIIQLFHADPDRLVTRIVHSSGEYIEDGGVPIHCVDKNNPQKLIGAGTYARRAGICAALGIAGEEDDDGQGATPKKELPNPKPKSQTKHDEAEPDWSDYIPEDKSIIDHVNGFASHKNIVQHQSWVQFNEDDINKLSKKDADYLLHKFQQRKEELTNGR